jgi:L-ascorbate metabolism protein UlaG (beta-lactamase superfamily)
MKIFLLLGFMAFLISCSSPRHQGPVSDHFDGEKFFNPFGTPPKGFWTVLKWQLTTTKTQWPEFVEEPQAPAISTDLKSDQIQLTLLNHASVYIQTQKVKLITDPIWSQRSSPFSWAGPKRARNASHRLDELPGVDIVLISHNHYDHFDEASLISLKNKFDPLFLIPLGDGKLLKNLGITSYQEMDWKDVFVHKESQSEIHFVRNNHWSARGLFDRNHSLWGSYVIKTLGKKIYFAGDTGYGNHFSEVYKTFGEMDISLLPIGAYEPRWMMQDQHINPEEAVQAHLDLKSKNSFGIHFRTFQLTNEGIEDPVRDLEIAKRNKNIQNFIAPLFGQSFSF